MTGGGILPSSSPRLRAGLRLPALAALAAGLIATGPRGAGAAVALPDDFVDQPVVGGLDAPTSFAFLPDGRVLVAEQNTGRVRLVVVDHVAASDPVLTVAPLQPFGESGLLGLAVDPRWPLFPYIYVMFTRPDHHEAIVRYRAMGQLDDALGETLAFGAPLTLIDDIRDEFAIHNAGCLRFGTDGCLYASLGDDAIFCDAADSTSLRGAILRLRVDRLPSGGGPEVARRLITPPDNPFVRSANEDARLVWAFGFRNPFRFQVEPVLGSLIVGDVGDQQFEEIDEVDRGEFMGWPWVEGRYPRSRPECPDTLDRAFGARGPLAVEPHGGNVGYAIISAGPYRPVIGAQYNWPIEYDTFRGDVFYGQYYEGYLRRLTWNGTDWVRPAPVPGQPNPDDWATGLLSSVDFLVGPDGSLWWLRQYDDDFTDVSGSLHRIVYLPGSAAGVGAGTLMGEGLSARPSPFRESVALSIRLDRRARGTLAIYDATGRRVRTIFRGDLEAGTSRMGWDGADEAGAGVSAGLYFARLDRENAPPLVARLLRVR